MPFLQPKAYSLQSVSLVFLLTALLSCSALNAEGRITAASIRGHVVNLEVVSTPDAMRQGLMFRDKLDTDAGMLFVYPQQQPLTFWMKNTRLPLSIAFINSEGVIGNIDDMAPFDDKTMHHSTKDAQYALEMNQGWFKTNGIAAGDKVQFLKTVDSEGGSAATTR